MSQNTNDPTIGYEASKIYNKSQEEIYYQTNFNFLKSHHGLRPSKAHLFLARTHGGKSTMVRSLFFDLYQNKDQHEKIGVWFTEENEQDFATEMSNHAYFKNALEEKFYKFYSELDKPQHSDKQLFDDLDHLFSQVDVVLIDNITTSRLYGDKNPQQQSKIAGAIKGLCKKHDKPVIIVAHTDATINESTKMLIEPNQIRGSKQLINLVEFLYIIQSVKFLNNEKEVTYSFIVLHKYRGQGKFVEDRIYSLNFDYNTQTFNKDKPIDMRKLKEIFQLRVKI